MNRIIVNGEQQPIQGVLNLSGAKNSALKVLTASVLTHEECILDNIPLELKDVKITLRMLQSLGASISVEHPGRIRLSWPHGTPLSELRPSYGSVRTNLLFLGALLGRTGKASVPFPGGCKIGERKHDLHLMALEKFGAHCTEDDKRILAHTSQLSGSSIEFPLRTTGGTENAILAGTCAQGTTRIFNAHTRPEVIDLINCLNTFGAKISIPGSGLVNIEGVERLLGGHHTIIYDNIEAITFTIFTALTKGSLNIRHFPEEDLEIPMIYLREAGIRFTRQGDGMIVERPSIIAPLDLSTGTYPGVNSDMQPLFTVLATQAEGISKITDIRFRNRFQYIDELLKMGADIRVEDNTVIIKGPTPLKGAHTQATDLRGGSALVAAALVAKGQTMIENAEQIDRGYEYFESKLESIGIHSERHIV